MIQGLLLFPLKKKKKNQQGNQKIKTLAWGCTDNLAERVCLMWKFCFCPTQPHQRRKLKFCCFQKGGDVLSWMIDTQLLTDVSAGLAEQLRSQYYTSKEGVLCSHFEIQHKHYTMKRQKQISAGSQLGGINHTTDCSALGSGNKSLLH